MSFGWSASDVALAAQFLHQACKALQETGGSREEYRESIAFVSGLEQTLKNVSAASNVFSQDQIAVETQALAQKVVEALKPFMSQLAKYEEPLSSLQSHRAHRKLRSKLEWRFSGRQKMQDFTDKITMPLANINTNLGIQIMQMVTELKDRLPHNFQQEIVNRINASLPSTIDPSIAIAAQTDKIDQVLAETQRQAVIQQHSNQSILTEMAKWQLEMFQLRDQVEKLHSHSSCLRTDHSPQAEQDSSRARELAGNLVKLVATSTAELLISLLKLLWPVLIMLMHQLTTAGRRLPFLLASDSIMLEDTLGRSHKLPYKFFQHWDMLQTYLVHSSQNSPALSYVLRGHYQLISAHNGRIIYANRWGSDAKVGSKVVMGLLETFISKGHCPGCHILSFPSVLEKGKWKSAYIEPDQLFVRPRDGSPLAMLSEQRRDNVLKIQNHRNLLPPPPMAPHVLKWPRDLKFSKSSSTPELTVKRMDRFEMTDPLTILDAIVSCVTILLHQTWSTQDDVRALQALNDAATGFQQEIQAGAVTELDFKWGYETFCYCASCLLAKLESYIQQQKITSDWQQFGWHEGFPDHTTCVLQEAMKERMSPHVMLSRFRTLIVLVKTLTGSLIPFRMYKQSTVMHLKLLIARAEGISATRQYLVYRGTKLDNDRTIESYDIRLNHYVYLLLPIWADRT